MLKADGGPAAVAFPRGQASLSGVGTACVRGAVTGQRISHVAFSLDGRRITPGVHRGTSYSAVISVRPGSTASRPR